MHKRRKIAETKEQTPCNVLCYILGQNVEIITRNTILQNKLNLSYFILLGGGSGRGDKNSTAVHKAWKIVKINVI